MPVRSDCSRCTSPRRRSRGRASATWRMPRREAVERLVEMTQPCDSDAARGIEARSRALVSRGEEAGDLYREAIDRLTQTGLRPDLARTHLLYGEWLRREGQRVSARQHL